jgi:DNA-binding GntR family transcriptional regulator
MRSAKSAKLELLMLKKTESQKTNQWVYQLLRTNLLCGKIQPGIPLTIRGVAEALDVSPMPVREALHRLACEGAVEVKNNRRVIVPLMTAEKFSELCDLRILLETHAAESALPYIREKDIVGLELIDAKIDEALQEGNVEDISLINQDFHRSLYSAQPFPDRYTIDRKPVASARTLFQYSHQQAGENIHCRPSCRGYRSP